MPPSSKAHGYIVRISVNGDTIPCDVDNVLSVLARKGTGLLAVPARISPRWVDAHEF